MHFPSPLDVSSATDGAAALGSGGGGHARTALDRLDRAVLNVGKTILLLNL